MSIEQQDSLPGKIMTRDFVMTSSSPLHGRGHVSTFPQGRENRKQNRSRLGQLGEHTVVFSTHSGAT